MNKKQIRNLVILFFICIVSKLIHHFVIQMPLSYSFFIEFNNANGIKIGTPIRMRGVHVGYVQSVKLKPNCVLVLAKIDSNKVLIFNDSIIETTQTGLLNEAVIDVVPFHRSKIITSSLHNPLSGSCNSSILICNNMYVTGDRGLNYDDLVRSTTRISQRFDDPRFFNLFYVFLHNGIELTDNLLEIFHSIYNVLFIY